MAGDGEDAQLWCVVDAVPLAPEHITWKRSGFPMDKRTVATYRNNTSYLTVYSVTKNDMGAFHCVVDNGIGNETSRTAHLIVKRKFSMVTRLRTIHCIQLFSMRSGFLNLILLRAQRTLSLIFGLIFLCVCNNFSVFY